MSLENRILLASLLSSIVVVGYLQVSSPKRTIIQHTQVQQVIQEKPTDFEKLTSEFSAGGSYHEERQIFIESDMLRLGIGTKSAAIHSVTLKQYADLATGQALQVGNAFPTSFFRAHNQSLQWVLERAELARAVFQGHEGQQEDARQLEIWLDETLPVVHIRFSLSNPHGQPQKYPLELLASWRRLDDVAGRYNMLETTLKTQKSSSLERLYLRYHEGIRNPIRVPRGTLLATLSERYFCQSIKPEPSNMPMAEILPSGRGTAAIRTQVTVQADAQQGASSQWAMYMGSRNFSTMKDAGFAEAFPTGIMTHFGIALSLVITWIASITKNYGVAIISLAALVTILLSPMTLLGLRSMKKMQELQPRLDQIKKKHEKEPHKVQQEMMALFREHRVSPFSGCLTILLQFPIFFALWSAVSHMTELRGQPFLWIKDLSLPDRLATLPFGLDLNLLPILTAGAMFVQTKLSQPKTPATPGMAMFSGPLMSIVFGVMFYTVPSGLVLYWFSSSVLSVAVYKYAHA